MAFCRCSFFAPHWAGKRHLGQKWIHEMAREAIRSQLSHLFGATQKSHVMAFDGSSQPGYRTINIPFSTQMITIVRFFIYRPTIIIIVLILELSH
jgi:hypothetical protein